MTAAPSWIGRVDRQSVRSLGGFFHAFEPARASSTDPDADAIADADTDPDTHADA